MKKKNQFLQKHDTIVILFKTIKNVTSQSIFPEQNLMRKQQQKPSVSCVDEPADGK
jgi:hypothetical protein